MPSGKIGVLLACCVLVVLLIGFSDDGNQFVQKVFTSDNKVKDLQVNLTYADLIEKDTDADGVKDWEEALWGTNKNNPDTNGDGIGDKDEIELLRAEKKGGAPTSFSNLNETDQFAREFFATTVALSESGNLSEQSVAALAENYAGGAVDWTQVKIYTEADLTIVADGELTNTAYSTAINNALTAYDIGSIEYINVIPTYIEKKDAQSLSVLTQTEATYAGIISELLDAPVPNNALPAHLSLINSLENHREVIGSILVVETNPIKTLSGVAYFPKSMEAISNAILLLQTYMLSIS